MPHLKDIVAFLDARVEELSENRIVVENALSITDPSFNEMAIGWCSDANLDIIPTLLSGNVIVSKDAIEKIDLSSINVHIIAVDHPRRAFMKVLQHFFAEKPLFGSIHPSAVIDPSVQLNKNTVSVAANVVIDKGSVLGNNVVIGANTVVKSHTKIGDNCSIGSNCTIGGVGFGYEMDEDGNYDLMPHIGNVVLHNNVEIGNNVCIDRAVMGSTILHENVKVDNLVHIAHGVVIGKNSLIIANAMIAGSVTIGENVWVSPSASVRQKLTIGDKSLVGLGSVVVKNVQEETVVAGNPAKVFDKK